MTGDAPKPEEIDLSPSKDTYDAVQSDVTPISAIKELIDNAIDNWERVYSKNKDLIIDINYDFDEDVFSIEDNGGGLEEENIEKLFALGETTKGEIDTPIGAYGVGAKKAIVKIGETAELVSRFTGQSFGYGYTIDQSWLEDPNSWDVTKNPYEDIEPGQTRIRVTNLKLDVGEIIADVDGDSVGENSSFSADDFFSRVKSDLSNTYEEFLKDDGTFEGDLVIKFNGEQIQEPEHLEWSFTPFDHFFPRAYEKITLKRHNLEVPVELDIIAGLTREGDQDLAGTDIFCQDRKVISNNDGTVGGFGRDDLDLGVLSSTNSRLRVRMYFRTEGNANRLPWDTQKNGIDEYDSLMQEAYEWFEKIVYPYWQASRYEKMPSHQLKPYNSQSDHAANNGTIREFNYQGRDRLSDRPNDDFEDVQEFNKILNDHLDLGISASQLVPARFRPAYNSAMKDSDEPIVEISDIPVNHSDVREILRKVRNLARKDAEAKVKCQTDRWWKPVYEHVLSGKVADEEDLEIVDREDVDDIVSPTQSGPSQSNGENSDISDHQQSSFDQEESPSDSTSGNNSQGTSSDEEDIPGTSPESTTTTTSKNESSSTSSKESSRVGSTGEGQDDRERASDDVDGSNQENQSTHRQGTTTSQGPDNPTGYRETGGPRPTVVMSFSPENKEKLCEYLDLPSDVGRDQFSTSLQEAIISDIIGE